MLNLGTWSNLLQSWQFYDIFCVGILPMTIAAFNYKDLNGYERQIS